MKITEMRELTTDELNQKIADSRKELFNARFQLALRQLENTAQLRTLRHRISQLQTVLAEKNLKKPAAAAASKEK